MERALLLDENVPRPLAAELVARGRPARALRDDPGAPTLDSEVIRWAGDAVVLVTADDGMPREHAALLRQTRLAVAVVAVRGEAARRETVHRWAHVMAAQRPGTVRRYSPRRGGS